MRTIIATLAGLVALATVSVQAALLAPPPRRQLALLAIVAILILTAGASAAEAARDLHALLEFAQAAR